MSGTLDPRHPSVDNIARTHILTCGCTSYAPGHAIHWIQARIFSTCPPEKIIDAHLTGWAGNHLFVEIDGEQHVAWHANTDAVEVFGTLAHRSAPGHTAYFRESGLLATSDGTTSAVIYANLRDDGSGGAGSPCRWSGGVARPARAGEGPAMV